MRRRAGGSFAIFTSLRMLAQLGCLASGVRHPVKLADIFVVINGHTLGPFVAVLPQDARGDDVDLDEGDDVHVVISPRTSGAHAVKARGTLRRS